MPRSKRPKFVKHHFFDIQNLRNISLINQFISHQSITNSLGRLSILVSLKKVKVFLDTYSRHRFIFRHIFEKHRICPQPPSKQKRIDSTIAKYILRDSKQTPDQFVADIIFSRFSSNAVTPLISISNFCMMEQQSQPVKASTNKSNSRIVKTS